MARKNYKISFCVVCMNRLHQLKQTLLQNISDNEDYAELEFIVLDYNSEDGMEEWAKENLFDYIKNGRVIYYKTTDPTSWSPSHSKNLAFKLATGEIVCSIWADYYTGKGFAQYVNDCYQKDDNIVLTPIDFHKTKKYHSPPGDVLGKVIVKKRDFLKIKGFDERMNKHGFEDYDFVNRLEMIGVQRVIIEDHDFLQYIKHDNNERYLLPTNTLLGMYTRYINPSVSEILFLYNNNQFDKGILIDNYTNDADNFLYAYGIRNARFEYSLKDKGWEHGAWKQNGKSISLSFPKKEITFLLLKNDGALLTDNKSLKYYKIDSKEVINEVLTFKHYYDTRSIMEENLKNNASVVNDVFGEAAVIKSYWA